MKKLVLFMYLFSLTLVSLEAQTKKLTMEEAVLGLKNEFSPETKQQLQWKGTENIYTFVDDNKLKAAKPQAEATTLVSLEDLNKTIKISELEEFTEFPEITWIDANTIQFFAQENLIHFQIEKKEITLKIKYPAEAENFEFDNVSKNLAYTKANNLYFADKNSSEFAVTHDEDTDIVNGNYVSRREYGITGGIFWSPDGEKLAFYSKDEIDVTSFPLVDITQRVGAVKMEKYPMVGMGSERVILGIYNLDDKKTVWIEPTDFSQEQYLTNISWGQNGKYIYIQVLNRETTHMKLNKYEAETGNYVQTLFEEKDDRWLEPMHKLTFLKKTPEQFVYQTNSRHGFSHLYLYNTDGKLIRQLTKGDWEVSEFLGFDKDEKNIYYISTESSPLERHAYKVEIKTGKKTQLTKSEGIHNVQLSSDALYVIDNYSSFENPRIIEILNNKGKQVQQLVKAENKLKDYKLGEITLGTIKSADENTDLYYRLVKPVDFDPNKKYPTVIYVYGGTHLQLVKNNWMGNIRLWEQYMAQEGYVVFTLDNRGSSGRGKEFEAVIHRQCGQAEMADQMEGVKFLKSQPYVDAERIGLHGWSYGGFMIISLMVNYPETFKVVVAGGPVIDWKWFEVMYTERYMDTPEENPDGYAKVSLIDRTKDLKGKLLICQGAVDNTVLWKQSLSFIRECIKNNVQVDYFPYPCAEHNVRGKDRIHLKQKVTNYFNDYLR